MISWINTSVISERTIRKKTVVRLMKPDKYLVKELERVILKETYMFEDE
jgi:hypothetical protein